MKSLEFYGNVDYCTYGSTKNVARRVRRTKKVFLKVEILNLILKLDDGYQNTTYIQYIKNALLAKKRNLCTKLLVHHHGGIWMATLLDDCNSQQQEQQEQEQEEAIIEFSPTIPSSHSRIVGMRSQELSSNDTHPPVVRSSVQKFCARRYASCYQHRSSTTTGLLPTTAGRQEEETKTRKDRRRGPRCGLSVP